MSIPRHNPLRSLDLLEDRTTPAFPAEEVKPAEVLLSAWWPKLQGR